MDIDQAKLDEFVGRAVGDLGSALTAALVVIGDKLGLYKALAQAGPLVPAELVWCVRQMVSYQELPEHV
jgi:hypothetical protein